MPGFYWKHTSGVLLWVLWAACASPLSAAGVVCPADEDMNERTWYQEEQEKHGATTTDANGWDFDKALVAYETAPLAGILRGGSVIDVGCGNAQYMKMVSEMHGVKTVVGVDPELGLVKAGRTVLPTATLCQAGH